MTAMEERTRTQEVALVQHRRRIAAHQRHECRMSARVRAESENVATLQEGFSSLRQEVDVYTAKLKIIYNRIQVSCRLISFLRKEERCITLIDYPIVDGRCLFY